MTAFGIDFGMTNSVLAVSSGTSMETVRLDEPPGEFAELGFDRVLPTVVADRRVTLCTIPPFLVATLPCWWHSFTRTRRRAYGVGGHRARCHGSASARRAAAYASSTSPRTDVARSPPFFANPRKHGHAIHARYLLYYERRMSVAQPLPDFVQQFCGARYPDFICRLLNVPHVRFRFHWHFTPNGGEVSPHCDSQGKIGSQIFYLNTPEDWDWRWGGETVILDDGGRIPPDNAPAFDDFDAAFAAQTQAKRSIGFGRRC